MHIIARTAALALGGVGMAAPVWAQDRSWDGWWHSMCGLGGMWGIGMMLMMFAFWAVLIVGLVLGIRWLVGQGREPRHDQAMELLRQRYARGEINKEEFNVKSRDLG